MLWEYAEMTHRLPGTVSTSLEHIIKKDLKGDGVGEKGVTCRGFGCLVTGSFTLSSPKKTQQSSQLTVILHILIFFISFS